MEKTKSTLKEIKKLSDCINITELKKGCPTYVPTGFEKLDKVLGGGLAPYLYVLGAGSSVGKSTFMLNVAENISKGGTPVLYFSLEMSMDFIARCSLCRNIARKNGAKSQPISSYMIPGFIENVKKSDIEAANKASENLYIASDRESPEFDKIIGQSNEFIKFSAEKFGKKPVIIVDYLQILRFDEKPQMLRQSIDRAVNGFWNLAHHNNVPVVIISSVNRSSYNQSISFEAFKESGGIEYTADVVLGLQFNGCDKEKFNINAAKNSSPRKLQLVVLKNRCGKTGDVLDLNYKAEYALYEESDVENTKQPTVNPKKPAKIPEKRAAKETPAPEPDKTYKSGDSKKNIPDLLKLIK